MRELHCGDVIERASPSLRARCGAAVRQAIKKGILVRASACQWCGESQKRIHAHHPDYARPLAVLWLCTRCHHDVHKGTWRDHQLFRTH